jgi:hypothetical protein
MKTICLIVIAALAYELASAQETKKYVVKEGMRPRDVISFNEIYLYPSFTQGKVYFKNGRFGGSRMNYNRFTGDVDFINGRDTLALADPESIKSIAIGNDNFYYAVGDGFVEKLNETTYATLAKKEIIAIADRRRLNTPAAATYYNTSITPGDRMTAGIRQQSVGGSSAIYVTEKMDMIYQRKTSYFFADSKGNFVKVNKKNLIKLFPGKKNNLSLYL